MTDRTLKGKVSRLQELQAEVDELTAQADAIRDSIKKEMEARAVDELEAGEAVVRWKSINSTRFDAKAFREAYSGLYAKFTVPSTTRRFTLVSA